MKKDITKILNKLAGNYVHFLTVTKKFPWQSERSVDLEFTIELVNAEIDEDLDLDLSFLVKPMGGRGVENKEHFSRIFHMFDFQSDLRDYIFNIYKLSGFGLSEGNVINYDFKFI